MNLYLVRAETEDGHNEDRHILANTAEQAVEVWKAEADVEWTAADFPEGFIVHRVLKTPFVLTSASEPKSLDWSFGERIPFG